MNRVIDSYNAEIDGRRTALSGCDTTECERRAWCLRADPGLAVRASCRAAACKHLIPIQESTS